MAVDIYKALNGFGIFGNASILSNSGAPGGDGSFQDNAAQGSIYLRTDNSSVYVKIGTANTTADWSKLLTTSGGAGISPANVADTTGYTNLAAAVTAYNSNDVIDGITIASGYRILLTDLSTGSKTVYTITGTTGSWSLTADPSFTPTAGDEVYIDSGTSYGGDIFTYDGTNWSAQSGSSILNELAFIRTFIGKSAAGNITPSYTSNNFVTDGESLENAISAIDAAVGSIGSPPPSTGITTNTVIDSVNTQQYDAIKWFVSCVDHTTKSNKQAVEIFAIHDGTSSADAVNVDFNLSSIISINNPPNGLSFSVTLAGSGSNQTMDLEVSSTTAVDIKTVRIKI